MSDIATTTDQSLLTADEDFDDDSHEALMSWCKESLEQFLSSSYCSSWKDDKKDIADFFIYGFVDYAYAYNLAKPFQRNKKVVEEICLDTLPRKMSTDAKDFKHVATVLIAFFEWCEKERVLKNIKVLQKTLKEIDDKIYEAAKDSSNWGIAKSLFSEFSS